MRHQDPHTELRFTSRQFPEMKLLPSTSVFACGPWLPKLFPELLGELIHVTRQEVFFFGVPPGDESFNRGVLPAWIDFNDLVYGLPNLDGRGFKIAIDAHGPEFDPDTGERVVTLTGLNAVREYLAQPGAATRRCAGYGDACLPV